MAEAKEDNFEPVEYLLETQVAAVEPRVEAEEKEETWTADMNPF